MSRAITFDPNKLNKPDFEWATYIPARNPKFKIHSNRGKALNAFNYRDNVILYRMVNGTWIEQYRIENFPNRPSMKPKTCDRCDKYEFYLSSEWDRFNGKIKDDPFKRMYVCSQCRRELRGRR